MTLYALVVAVETYQDSNIPSVTYAENDATAFSKSIEGLGVSPGNVTLLTNSTATKAAVESKLRTLTKYLEEGDEFFLYYAGHGFSQAGKNYILCHDTMASSSIEAALTSIPLDSIFNLIRNSKCKSVSLFLDSCHSGLEIDGDMRSFVSRMTDEEFKDFCGQSEHYVAFSACSTNEISYSTPMLKHGVWTYHLIQALSGNAPSALERTHFLTSSSLQNYLSLEVPRKLRDVRTDKAVQTPTCWGNMSREFIVADLDNVIAAKRARKGGGNQIKDTILQHTSFGSVRSLSGFKKNHRVPDSISFATRSFVQTIGANEVGDIVDSIHEKLKKKIKYKRKDLKIESDDGFTTIATPDFTYGVYLDIDEEDPRQYVLVKSISEIQNPEIIADERFYNIFDGCFDTVEIALKKPIKVEDLIDMIEECDAFPVVYPSDTSYCSISLNGHGLTIRFEMDKIILSYSSKYQIETMLSDCKKLPLILNEAGISAQLTA